MFIKVKIPTHKKGTLYEAHTCKPFSNKGYKTGTKQYKTGTGYVKGLNLSLEVMTFVVSMYLNANI